MALAKRATASIPFFTNLLRLNPSPQVVAPFTTRSVHTVDPLRNYPDEETVTRHFEYLELLERSKHPFIRRGPPSPYLCMVYGDKVYLRVDMPGVGKEGFKFWPVENYYLFRGLENDNDQDKEEKRVYSVKLLFDPACVVKESINAVIQNGVLRVVFRACSSFPVCAPIFLNRE